MNTSTPGVASRAVTSQGVTALSTEAALCRARDALLALCLANENAPILSNSQARATVLGEQAIRELERHDAPRRAR